MQKVSYLGITIEVFDFELEPAYRLYINSDDENTIKICKLS